MIQAELLAVACSFPPSGGLPVLAARAARLEMLEQAASGALECWSGPWEAVVATLAWLTSAE